MAEVKVTIKGKSPLLMHRYPLVPIETPPIEKRTPEDQAEIAAYRDKDTEELYIPGTAIQRALVNAGVFSKGKGRASLQKNVAACVLIDPEIITLGTKEYKIDARPIVVPSTKGRVVRYRPRLDSWSCSFSIEFDESLLTEKQLRQIVDDAGTRVGLLDFRPACKGPFGRFMVTKWTD